VPRPLPKPEPKASPRKQRALETRDRIFYAACELFLGDGYQGTSVDRIATHAGVAKGTFFVHFKTKDAVIAQLIENQTGSAKRARARAQGAGGGPLEALEATVLALGRLAGESKTLSRAVLAATLESAAVGGEATQLFASVSALMREDARAAKRAKLLAPRADPERLAWSLLAAYLGSVLHFATHPSAPPLLESLKPLVEVAFAAAGAKPRRALRKRAGA
jgi:AcrR family transcriptional regulator